MKTKLLLFVIFNVLFSVLINAQNSTIIRTNNYEIRDNLDLKIVASVFGDSGNLQDFEQKLNDPRLQISNLDLNEDNLVDYLRVIETIENNNHLVVIQAVLDYDVYQDVASIEIEKSRNRNIRIQIVGNSFFYGPNCVYQPVFYSRPLIYANFWRANYRSYCSSWNWNHFPSSYYSWNSCPTYTYQNNLNRCYNRYRNNRFVTINIGSNIYSNRFRNSSFNGYERQHPENSYSNRNSSSNNRVDSQPIRNYSNQISRNEVDNQSRNYSQNRTQNPTESSNRRRESQRETISNRNTESQRNIEENIVLERRNNSSQNLSSNENYSSSRNGNRRL